MFEKTSCLPFSYFANKKVMKKPDHVLTRFEMPGVLIDLPKKFRDDPPCQHAWVVRISKVDMSC